MRDEVRDHIHSILTDPDPDQDNEAKAIERKSTAPIQVATFEVS